MIWKRYQNELIVAVSVILLLSALVYKNVQVSSSIENMTSTKYAVREFKEIIAHKKRWADKKIHKKIDKLQSIVPVSKLTWNKKGKKLSAKFESLTSKELNKVITSILNLAIQIQSLEVKTNQKNYDVEFKCKW